MICECNEKMDLMNGILFQRIGSVYYCYKCGRAYYEDGDGGLWFAHRSLKND